MLSFKPVKWLQFVCYAICGVHGYISKESLATSAKPSKLDEDDETLTSDGVYFFISPNPINLECAIDPEFMKIQSIQTGTSNRSGEFATGLWERDGGCPFSHNSAPAMCQGAHLFRFARGTDWMVRVLSRRGEDSILDINDLRNGLLLRNDLHNAFDTQGCAILYTPNGILECEDIPRVEESYPDTGEPTPDKRYTLQWLRWDVNLHEYFHNVDGVFHDCLSSELPSPAILHYIYGAAVLTNFGGQAALMHLGRNVPDDDRPSGPTSAPSRFPHETTFESRKGRNQAADANTGGDFGGTVQATAHGLVTVEDLMDFLTWVHLPQDERDGIIADRMEHDERVLRWVISSGQGLQRDGYGL